MKPLIGITCSWNEEKGWYFLGKMYVEAVEAAGGIPVPLVYTSEDASIKRVCGAVSGIVFSGGVDVDPVYFGEEPVQTSGEICPDRDHYELKIARVALASNIPVLGICRGMQVLNIAAGGDIYQDIETCLGGGVIKHFQEAPRWHPTHGIEVEKKTALASLLGHGPIRVNSYHHQAVRNLAPGFTVSAKAQDGVVEAIESGDFTFAMGVQWHPETLWKRHPLFLDLFVKLADAARLKAGAT